MTLFLQALVGAIVWTFANLLYVDLKRKGVRSLARVVAFWVGMPTTWLSLIFVRELRQPRFRPSEDDEALLAEVRRDRVRRLSAEGGRTVRRDEDPDRPPRARDGHARDHERGTDTT